MSSVTPQQSDGNQPQPHLVISAHNGINRRAAYLSDGRVVASSDSRTVKVWNVENGEQEGTSMDHEGLICGLAATRDGTKIITSDQDGEIEVWGVESHKLVKKWIHPESWPGIAISPDDRLIAVGDWAVVIYTIEGKVNRSIEVGDKVWFTSFSPDGKKLACGTWSDIRVYDVDHGTLSICPLVHRYATRCVLWSHDGSRLFSGSDDKTIRCWNSETGKQIGHPWTGHTGNILSLSLSPDGSILASASRDRTVRLWDPTTGNPIGQHLQHVDAVLTVCFSPSGDSVASGGLDGKIYLWRVPWLNPIKDLVITPFMCVFKFLVLTVFQAGPTLPGIEYVLRGVSPSLYASIFSIGPSFRSLIVLCSHFRQLVPLHPHHHLIPTPPPRRQWTHSLRCPLLSTLLHYTF